MKSFAQQKIKSQKIAAILLMLAATFLLITAFEQSAQFENINVNIQMASLATLLMCGVFGLTRSLKKQIAMKAIK